MWLFVVTRTYDADDLTYVERNAFRKVEDAHRYIDECRKKESILLYLNDVVYDEWIEIYEKDNPRPPHPLKDYHVSCPEWKAYHDYCNEQHEAWSKYEDTFDASGIDLSEFSVDDIFWNTHAVELKD